ncbi:MAG: MmgE/PrpD family protein [Propionibacteriales bacterium]|nr:MmgE/PrpD family protein [Propionibacteriales bacterium]
MHADAPVTTALAQYVADAEARQLPADVVERAKLHIIDALVAMISGATLRPGRLAAAYALSRGGVGESTIVGHGARTNPELAALVNGMSAHADETDDVNDLARVHPGASVVPAAVAMGEALDRPGSSLLAAVAVGYDVACSVNIAAWRSLPRMQKSMHSPHGIGQAFGAAAAAASVARLPMDQHRYVLSYTAQQVSGISSFYRSPDHIGKAFASAGMQAHSGVRSVEMVRAGFTDVSDVFDVSPHAYDAFGEDGDPGRLVQELGTTHHVMTTDIKQYPVGMPIQAPAEALERLLHEHGLTADDIESVEARLPTHGSRLVNARSMPDISLQYVLAVMLMDGRLTFDSAHDYRRHEEPETREVMARIQLVPDETLDPPDDPDPAARRTRIATVNIRTYDGRRFSRHVDAPRGSRHNPMSWSRIADKAHMVLDGVIGPKRVDTLTETIRDAERLTSVRQLRDHLDVHR